MFGNHRHRITVIVAIIAVNILLMGCWVLDLFVEQSESEFWEYNYPDAIKTSTPETYYDDTEATVISPEDEEIAEGAEMVLFDNFNILAVQNGGTSPTFEVLSAITITNIQTYHWNDANGHSSTGTISLKADDGTVYGPWATVGAEGQGGVPNAYWVANPNVTIPAGHYTVIDSDPSTWSQNADSGGEGFVIVYGQAVK